MIVKVVSAQGLNNTWYKEKSKTTSYLNSLREMNHNDLSFKILSLAETLNAENPCASSSVNCSDIVQKHYVNVSCNDNYDKYGELKFSTITPLCLPRRVDGKILSFRGITPSIAYHGKKEPCECNEGCI